MTAPAGFSEWAIVELMGRSKVRKPLRARKPMRRTRIKPKPPRRLKTQQNDAAYREWVKTLPCAARFISSCSGPMDPHHCGRRPGMSMKCDDRLTISLCRGHHRAIETLSGFPFRAWTKALRLAWYDEQLAWTAEVFADQHREAGLPAPSEAFA